MQRIGVRALQQNASATLRRVKRGSRVEITERGSAVALLVPIPAGDVLEKLESAGRLKRADGDVLELGPPLRRRGKLAPSRQLAKARRGGR